MKVLFFISVMGHGRGGHFHSLNHIAEALSEHVEALIISVGPGRSQIINNHKCFHSHIDTKEVNFIRFRKKIREILKQLQPDVIHCFDSNIFNLLRLALYPQKSKIVVNLCGGPNPRFFPKVSHLVLFSEENKEWFQRRRKFKRTSISLIPNRVNKKVYDQASLKRYPLEKEKSNFTFVRISRIGSTYKKSIDDSIRLIRELKKSGINQILLYIVGTIEDQEIYEALKLETQDLPVRFLTDDIYTYKASDMLYLADAVIATGRGVMEATALGKPVLAPALNSEIPLLLKKDNFYDFFKVNFSERSIATGISIKENIDQISSMILDKAVYEECSNFSTSLFNEKFDITEGCKKYLKVYNDISPLRIRYGIFDDIFNQAYYFLKFFRTK